MRMTHHQLPLFQRRELGLHGLAQHGVARCRQLVGVHAAEERRPGIADDPAMDLRTKLLRSEEHETEVPAAFREIEQHLSHIGVLSIVRRVLVQLVDEHDDVIHAEVALLEVLAKASDDARKDQVLRVLLE